VKLTSFAFSLLFASLAACGCAPTLTCDESFNSGGEVVGATDSDADGVADSRWVVTEPCEDIVTSPPEPVTLQKQPPHLSGSSPPKEASGEWCMNLSLLKDAMGTPQVNEFYPWIPRVPLRQRSAPGQPVWYDAYLHYAQSPGQIGGQYAFGAVLSGPQRLELSARCLRQQGVALSCEQLAPLLTEKYAETDARIGRSTGAVSTANWICGRPQDGDGCACVFNMTITYDPTTGPGGGWSKSGDVLSHFDEVGGGAAFLSNYSVEDGMLKLSGYHRRPLFGIEGLRTLKLQQVVCNDGAQGVGEDGVDCGSNCPGNPPCP
jgi:hypothetical protein